MAPMATPRRRSSSELESDDEDGIVNPSSSRNKRARYGGADSLRSATKSPLANGIHLQSNGLHRETLRAQGLHKKYQPGSIVKVKLENFVTYTAVEFFPGPNLNMVIGPNGTGKSTLVCAICIGLGWGPQYLGRAKEVSEFVKHGAQEASIEIELAKDGRKFKRNVVIRCVIKKDGNKTAYSVNGENKSKKATQELARSLSIQIDNLCQFLPQDKVVEFAAMTPVELLRSTQRAVADQDMIDTHEELKEKRRNQKDLNQRIDADQEVLNTLENRQRVQEADVERMREREDVVKHISHLEAARPFAEYRHRQGSYRKAKEKTKKAQKELVDLTAEVGPSLTAIREQEVYNNQCIGATETRRKAVTKAEEHCDKTEKKHQALIEREKEAENQAQAEKKAVPKSRSEINRIDGNIQRLRRQQADPPPEVDTSAYNERIRGEQRLMDEAESRAKELQDQQREIRDQGREVNQRIQEAGSRLEDLGSQAGKQNLKLQMLSKDTFRGWEWIQKHQDGFEKPIYGPPVVECSVPDTQYVDPIEGLFQRNVLLSFTVQTKNDFAKLSHILHDQLRLSEINIKTVTQELDYFHPPISTDEMKQYGFDSWAIDYLQGPSPVLAMLCAEMRLHETGISLRDTTPLQYEMLQRSSLSYWVTSKSIYRITRRREYGAGATSTKVSEVRPARYWTDQPVDVSAKREIEEKIQGWNEEVAAFSTQLSNMKVQIEAHRESFKTHQVERNNIAAEKDAKQKALLEFRGLPSKIEQEEGKRKTAQEALDDIKKNIREASSLKAQLAMERARVALSYVDSIGNLRLAHSALHEAEIMSIEAISDLQSLNDRNRSVTELLETRQKEIDEFTKEANEHSTAAKTIMVKCREILDTNDEELKAFLHNTDMETTTEELENEISSEKARLELMQEGNGSVLRDFEQRRKKIEGLTNKLNDYKSAKTELDQEVTALQNNWEPKLDELVNQISEAFSFNMQQISCAGEVGVFKDDDFDQWSIQIRVKFRESEPMSILDSHRQSGGERAVSTIFYLMSLQSLTRSPFRIVDEINQGMDPRNERLVHKRMVAIACGTSTISPSATNGVSNGVPDSGYASASAASVAPNGNSDHAPVSDPYHSGGSQYFLITPKLLHDLEYARGMQVLCIASGEFMPSEQSRVDFRGCVDLMRGMRGLDVNGGSGIGGGRVGVTAR